MIGRPSGSKVKRFSIHTAHNVDKIENYFLFLYHLSNVLLSINGKLPPDVKKNYNFLWKKSSLLTVSIINYFLTY